MKGSPTVAPEFIKTPEHLRARGTDKRCSVEGCDRKVIARGWCEAHWHRWRKSGKTPTGPVIPKASLRAQMEAEERQWGPIIGKRGPVRGPCKVCKRIFRSFGARLYCSMDCYTHDPEAMERLRKRSKADAEKRRAAAGLPPGPIKTECRQCGTEVVAKCLSKVRKFCGKTCQRRWYAERFDRWIANPESIALPQNYDEFFTRETLPCPVAGCSWEGKSLGYHVNVAHGVTADRMRELLGCNRKTGLCTPDVSDFRSQLARQLIQDGILAPLADISMYRQPRHDVRREGIERQKKVSAELVTTPSGRKLPCRNCGKEVDQMLIGQRLYCDDRCRSEWYRKSGERDPASCAWCGREFLASAHQTKAMRKGKTKVFCDVRCRQKHNSATPASLAYHRRRADAAKQRLNAPVTEGE